MKKLIFIFSISFFIFSCKKDKIKDISNLMNDCPKAYNEHSVPLDVDIYQSTVFNAEAFQADTLDSYVKINPNNPNEIFFLRKTKPPTLCNLYSYNFCTNTLNLLIENNIFCNTDYDVSSNGWILFKFNGYWNKMKTDGSAIIQLPYLPQIGYVGFLFWSPDGDKIMTSSGELLNEDGELIKIIDFQENKFLGWFDNDHILIANVNEVYVVNINNESTSIFIQGKFNSYDSKAQRFTRVTDSLSYRKTSIHSLNGSFLNETPFYKKPVFVHSSPQFLSLNSNKMIVNLMTQENYPDYDSFQFILQRERIAIMDLDGTNVREVKFPE